MTEEYQTNWEQLLALALFLRNRLGTRLRDQVVADIYHHAERIAGMVLEAPATEDNVDQKIDRIVTSKIFGYPLMLLLLSGVFWLTLTGANYPSALLSNLLFGFQDRLTACCHLLGAPAWLHGVLVLGLYRCLAWVTSVMLPPMAIFFPLFTFLEDLGYLPRIAFNLDKFFKKAGAHGKQVLTMCMGFGCNAAGVIACRIIDSPRERLIAILTNNFVPCNGRFPMLFTIAAVLVGALITGDRKYHTLLASGLIVGIVLLGIITTLLVSWLLSKTILKGVPSTFTLELPSYRLPKIGALLIRSVFDRTLFVLKRAVLVAAPAGALTWILANTQINGVGIITRLAEGLQGFGKLLGLDGYIILAFLLGLPANEIVIPILVMSYLTQGVMMELGSIELLRHLLMSNGWTWLTALNMLLFSLFHYPCATTLLTIRKETQKTSWTLLAAVIPTVLGALVCFLVTTVAKLLALV